MQTTLLTLAIAVILALLAALLGPHFIDWNAQRGRFEQQASALIGLPVTVEGDMQVRLLPSPSLSLSGIGIGKPGDPQALRAKGLGIEFALPALLSGKLRAVELKVIGPQLRLSLDRKGRAVLPQALAGLDTEALSIDRLQIEDARVELSDAASTARRTLDKLQFIGEVRALPGPFRGEGAFVMDGDLYGYRISAARPEANGSRVKFTLDPSGRFFTAEAEGLVTATGGAPRFDGQVIVARRPVPLKGDKASPGEPWRITTRVKADAMAALFEQVEFQFGPDERAIKLAGAAEAKFGAAPRLDAVLSARQLDADKLIAVADGETPAPRAAIATLLKAVGELARPPIPTQLGFGIDAVTLGGATLQDLRGDIEIAPGRTNLTSLEFRAPGYARIQASGAIDLAGDQSRFTGPVEFSATDPRAFSEWLDGKANAAPLPSRPLKLRGDVTLGPGWIAVERMTADYDRNAFDGSLSYASAEAGGRARFAAKVRADDLDLDAWLGLFGATLSDVAKPRDLSLALTLGRLRFAGFEAGKADIAIDANATGLTIERFSIGDLAGAALNAKGRVDLDRELRGGIGFDLSLREPAALRALAERFAPSWADSVARAAPLALPAKLEGRLDIEPASGGASRFNLAVKGPLGANRLDLATSLIGVWNSPRKGDIALKAALDLADVNTLLSLIAPDRFAPVARQSGRYTLALAGKPEGEMRVDTRLASAALDLRAAGALRALASEDRSGALDVAIGPSPETRPRLLWPGAPAGGAPLALKTVLKFDSVGLRFDNLQASLGETSVTGRLGVGFDRPMVVDGDLKSDAIDLAALLAAVAGLGAPSEKAQWSETPFSVSAWPSMIGAVSVSAARASISPSTQAANLRAGLRFTGKDVAMEPIEADLFGGRLVGEATIRRGGEGLGISGRIALRDADAARLLTPENPSVLSGRAGLELRFDGSGRSPRALIGSLHGGGKLTLEKGKITALDPKAFAAVTRSIDQGLPLDAARIRDAVTRALASGPLLVPQAEAQLSVAAGVVRMEAFSAKAEAAELLISGSYQIADSALDLRLVLRGPESDGIEQRPELAIQLRGPAASPQRSLDVSSLTGWLALRAVEQQARKIEAIERSRPAEAAVQSPAQAPVETPAQAPAPAPSEPEAESSAALPEAAPALPRKRPAPQAAAPRVEPLPPPVEVPARPRIVPRADAPARPAEAQSNPFPKPIGEPPPAQPAPRPGGLFSPLF